MTNDETPAPVRVDAVVLAGSINRIPLYPGNTPGRKALVELGGRPLIAYVLDALHESKSIDHIVVIGAREVRQYACQWPRVIGFQEGHALVRNVYRGIIAARTDRILYCNPDQPLLRAEMIDDFVERALPIDADLVTSWVNHDHVGRYAGDDHKFAEFGDGRFAHGNLFLLRRDISNLQEVRRRLDRLYQARKNTVRFAWELGPALFLKFIGAMALHQLPTLCETLDIAGKHFGVKLAALTSEYPEIVFDIDEPEDYAFAERFITGGERGPASSEVVAA
jgi:CTP:molybdopterin cytidylyltransferase MocA